MKKAFIIFGLCVTTVASQANPRPKPFDGKQGVFHKIVVEEVIQTTSYTYLHVKETDSEKWLAIPSMQAKAGDTYYYTGGLSMKKFESKELHKTFDEVLFLGGVTTAPTTAENGKAPADATHSGHSQTYTRKATTEVKKSMHIDSAKGGTTIADLFSKKEALAGKKVIVKGEVTKYSASIMDKNWIHIQDGTDFNGKYDLTVTSTAEVKVGDIVTMEGTVTLNKDFGYGYFFEVIIEQAALK